MHFTLLKLRMLCSPDSYTWKGVHNMCHLFTIGLHSRQSRKNELKCKYANFSVYSTNMIMKSLARSPRPLDSCTLTLRRVRAGAANLSSGLRQPVVAANTLGKKEGERKEKGQKRLGAGRATSNRHRQPWESHPLPPLRHDGNGEGKANELRFQGESTLPSFVPARLTYNRPIKRDDHAIWRPEAVALGRASLGWASPTTRSFEHARVRFGGPRNTFLFGFEHAIWMKIEWNLNFTSVKI